MKMHITTILLLGLCSSSNAKGLRASTAGQRTRILQVPSITANDDSYEVIQGETLYVEEPGLLANDVATSSAYITVYDRLDDFQGKIKTVKVNGRMEYRAPSDFVGTDQFTYEVCLENDHLICDTATVTINVLVDPNRPNANPTAVNDNYSVVEGQELNIGAPGFLDNDTTGTPSNPLLRCYRGGSPTGKLDTHQDGSFSYQAQRCDTGTDSFTYQACYEDFKDMKSNVATVTIQITQDPARPSPPVARDDQYQVFDAEKLIVEVSNGLLQNDAGTDTLQAENVQKLSGFQGDLKVSHAGSFEYTPEYGQLGEFRFTYDACFSDWSCVDCRTATVTIEVQANPDKPQDPPTLEEQRYEIVLGESLSVAAPGVLTNAVFETEYNLRVTEYDTGDNFVGVFNGERDGSFEYGNGPPGEAIISFTACYKEWPDVCSDGQLIIETRSLVPSDRNAATRPGIATNYEIRWAGRPETECDAVEPSLQLSCKGNGELNLLDVGINDNSICSEGTSGSIVCAAKHSGVVYAECRDIGANMASNREIIVQMSSEPVACANTRTANTPIYWAYHSMSLNTWCDSAWVNNAISCSGELLEGGTSPSLCYEDDVTLGTDAQPMTIIMRSTSYQSCFFAEDSRTVPPGPQLASLGITGNDGNPASAFPLQACQGDCDSDNDCASGLSCFQRTGNEIVPGCVGTPENGRDYCIVTGTGTGTGTGTTTRPEIDYVGNNGSPASSFPMEECEGDCDSDSDCRGSLICYQRTAADPIVPGCAGAPRAGDESDYCIQPPIVVGGGTR